MVHSSRELLMVGVADTINSTNLQDIAKKYAVPSGADIIYFNDSSFCNVAEESKKAEVEVKRLCDFIELVNTCRTGPANDKQGQRWLVESTCMADICTSTLEEELTLCVLEAMGLNVAAARQGNNCSSIQGLTAPLWEIPSGHERQLSCALSLPRGAQMRESIHCVGGVTILEFTKNLGDTWVPPERDFFCIFDFQCVGTLRHGLSLCYLAPLLVNTQGINASNGAVAACSFIFQILLSALAVAGALFVSF